jgi:hypothetical protein
LITELHFLLKREEKEGMKEEKEKGENLPLSLVLNMELLKYFPSFFQYHLVARTFFITSIH